MKTKILFLIYSLIMYIPVFAYDDEDDIDPESSFYMILAGIVIFVVGSIISQVKFIQVFGNIIKGIGFFIGALGVLSIALLVFQWAVKTAITLVIYLGAILAVGYILYKLFQVLFGDRNE